MSVKRWIALLAALVCCVAMTACGNNGDATTTTTTTRPTVAERDDTVETAYPNEKAGFQMQKPAAGDQIAILHTDAGGSAGTAVSRSGAQSGGQLCETRSKRVL